MEKYTEQPIFFNRNRVWRVYKGGALLERLIEGNEKGEDSDYPEEWIASVVEAINPNGTKAREGLSAAEGTGFTLKELIEKYPEKILGKKAQLGILVKYLDSAVRLPVQVHPDRDFSRKYLNDIYGKTEMWIVLDTRKDACIYLGFKEHITREEFAGLIERSECERDVLASCLNRVEVKAGDVYLIPGKTVHAIGAGCLVLEIQEPTDYTIQPEYWCGDYRLSDEERYIGLLKERAIQCFDFGAKGQESISACKKSAVTESEDNNYRKERIVSGEETHCFGVNRYRIKTEMALKQGAAVYVVTDGRGKVTGDKYARELKKGNYFFMPAAAKGRFRVRADRGYELEIIECIGAI